VIEVGITLEKVLELYPPRLNVLLHHPNLPDQSGPSARIVTVSKNDALKDVCATLAQAVRPDQTTSNAPYRVWRLKESLESQYLHFPITKLNKDQAELLSDADGDKTISDAYIENDDTFIVEFQHDGKWNINTDDANADSKSGAVSTASNFSGGPPSFEDGDYFSKMSTSFSKSRALALNGPSSSSSSSFSRLGSSNASSSTTSSFFGMVGTRLQPAYEPGTLGLGNMFVSVVCRLFLRT
jgi:hypothetical protein